MMLPCRIKALLMKRSSRREEALISSGAATSIEKLEPPHVGCYEGGMDTDEYAAKELRPAGETRFERFFKKVATFFPIFATNQLSTIFGKLF
jgi:hypothetical protein